MELKTNNQTNGSKQDLMFVTEQSETGRMKLDLTTEKPNEK